MLAFLGERATLLRAAVTRFQVTSSGKNQPLLLFFTQVIGEFERQDETGTCFDVPSEVLKNIRFNPLEPQTVQSPVSVGEIPATTVENRGFSPAVLDNIARELSDVEVLHRGVIELRKRKRAVHQISVNEENPGETSSDPEIEKVVKEIWTEQLGIEPDSIHKNFFDVGGNSFMLPFIAVQLKEKLGCDVSMIELFQFTTIVALTEHICVGKRLVNTYSAINQIAKKQMDARLQMRKKTGF
jgi:acyl carrier protein